MFAVRDYQEWNIIEVFDTYEEAVECIKSFEEQDIKEGIYEPGFYEITEL